MGFLGVLAGLVPFLRTKTPHEEALVKEKSTLEEFLRLCEEVKKGADAAFALAQGMVRNLSGRRASAYPKFLDDRNNLNELLSGMAVNIRRMEEIRDGVSGGIMEKNYFSVQFQRLQACIGAVSGHFSAVTKSDNPDTQQLTDAAAALQTMVSTVASTGLPNLKQHAHNLAGTIISSASSGRSRQAA